MVRNLISSFLSTPYTPLNIIEIGNRKLTQNYRFLSSVQKHIKISPVLKSNAYGHGIEPVARVLQNMNPPFFCVDSIFEAYQLYKARIRIPLLIMGYVNPSNLRVKPLPFSYAVSNIKQAAAIYRFQPQAKIHLFVDTGMHREGLNLSELSYLVSKLKRFPGNFVEGAMSHFASTSPTNRRLVTKQISDFKLACKILHTYGIRPKFVHIQASSGLLHVKGPDFCNTARCGLAVYGIDPDRQNINLKPVLTFKTHVVQIKRIKKGERVGYDFTFAANKNIVLAVLPLGYNDGVDRRLSNKGVVRIRSFYAPIVGRVSMNITSVDVTNIPHIKIGDTVINYSSIMKDRNSILNTSRICNTIPYEILVNFNSSIKRVLV